MFILLLTFFFGDNGAIEILRSRQKIDNLRERIESLEKQKEELIEEIKELRQNPLALEKKAREKLWLMKKNEKVIVIMRNEKKKKKEAKSKER